MPKTFPFSLSLSGVNPEVFSIFKPILMCNHFFNGQHIDDSQFRQLFLAILGETQVVPFFTTNDLQRMTMRSGSLKVLLQYFSRSNNRQISFRIIQIILRRIVNQMVHQIGAPEIERCMRVFTSYIAHSEVPPAIRIVLYNRTLKVINSSKHLQTRWFFLLLELPDPRALQRLSSSCNEDLRLAILCREFREIFKSRNLLFLRMVEGCSYEVCKKLFFRFSRTRSFKRLNKSFRILKRVFRDQLLPGMSHYDSCERIVDLFFELMSQTEPETWLFLRRVFAEESLEALCDQSDRRLMSSQAHFSFPLHYPGFNLIPCSDSIQMLQRLRRVHSLRITPGLIQRLQVMSGTYHDESWKSIWAYGLYWIVTLSSIIQTGDPFLNFVFHSVIHERRDFLYAETLDLFLEGAKNVDSSLLVFWVHFLNMQGRYLDLGRSVSFSHALTSFLDIVGDPQFFGGFHQFCSQDFNSHYAFQISFLQFCQSMRNSAPENIFGKFFYPRVYEICRICRAKILHSIKLKSLKKCENCFSRTEWDASWSDDED